MAPRVWGEMGRCLSKGTDFQALAGVTRRLERRPAHGRVPGSNLPKGSTPHPGWVICGRHPTDVSLSSSSLSLPPFHSL